MKKVVAVILLVVLMCANLASAETMTWQVIRVGYGQYIKVIYEYPENMEVGDEISFYCEFQDCYEDDFNYTWQHSEDGKYWTNFGSKSRNDTIYSAMLAGKYVRLVVDKK